ncbi:hypothetical protein DASC09_059280 [Saccharomycopsis crataegensis]|uniref:Uncharacterized protein n=1 Tax=Saccharomycopsis crataegensis TaxID=43959 RepID=A0AAV5QV42_9ASCO|nr:hypothetical protein DASC09_059280 [Saccharomycopsis crataegensis]
MKYLSMYSVILLCFCFKSLHGFPLLETCGYFKRDSQDILLSEGQTTVSSSSIVAEKIKKISDASSRSTATTSTDISYLPDITGAASSSDVISETEIEQLIDSGDFFAHGGSYVFRNSSGYYFINGTALSGKLDILDNGSSSIDISEPLVTSLSQDEIDQLVKSAEEKYKTKDVFNIQSTGIYEDIGQLKLIF